MDHLFSRSTASTILSIDTSQGIRKRSPLVSISSMGGAASAAAVVSTRAKLTGDS
jgi:hypothetical protein